MVTKTKIQINVVYPLLIYEISIKFRSISCSFGFFRSSPCFCRLQTNSVVQKNNLFVSYLFSIFTYHINQLIGGYFMENYISRDYNTFTGKEKTYLKQGEFMRMGDILFSPGGCWRLCINDNSIYATRNDKAAGYAIVYWGKQFPKKVNSCYAIMQEDGNFCVYEGDNPKQRGALLWNAGVKTGKIATMQSDGKFCLYNIFSPEYRQGCIAWECGFHGEPVERYEILEVEYDYNNIVKQPPVLLNAFTQILNNHTGTEQQTEISFTVKESEKHYWENHSSTSFTIKGSISYGIPFGPKIGVEISGGFNEESINGNEVVTEKTKSYTVPVKVPPRTSIKVVALISKNTLQIPYKYIGRYIVKGGCQSDCNLIGNFVVNDTSELQVGFEIIEDSIVSKTRTETSDAIQISDDSKLTFIDKSLIKEVLAD